MTHKSDQSGFSAVECLLVVVIVLIVGFVGWFIWNSNKEANKTLDDTAKSTQNTKSEPKKDAISSSSSENSKKYLEIKEWGVKIPLSAVDAGAYYEIDPNISQPKDDPTNLIVYATQVDELTGPAGISCKGEYVAYVLRLPANVLRLPANDVRWQPSQSIDDGNVSSLFGERIQTGDYRYALATKKQYGPQCFLINKTGDYTIDQTTSQKFADVVDAFYSGFKNVTTN